MECCSVKHPIAKAIGGSTMKRLIALAALAAAPAFGFEPERDEYEPLKVRSCDPLTSLSIINDESCLIVGGSVQQALFYSTQDGWFPASQNFLYFSGLTQSDLGASEAHIRLRNETGWSWTPFAPGPVFTNTLEIDRAFVAIESGSMTFAAGKRERGIDGSIANLSEEQPFRHTILTTFSPWPQQHLGGHVVQASLTLSDTLTAAFGAEALDGSGTLIGSLSYAESKNFAHLTAGSTGLLAGPGDLFVHTGFTFDQGRWRVGGFGEIDGVSSRGMLNAEIDILHASFRTIVEASHSPQLTTSAWGLGVNFAITESLRLDLMGQAHWQGWGGAGQSETSVYHARLDFDLAEHVAAFGRVGVYSLGWAIPPQDVVFWEGGAKYEIKDRLLLSGGFEGNNLGAYKLKTVAKVEF